MKTTLPRLIALSSPFIWFASHTAQFALAPLTCTWRSNAILWIASALALMLDAGSGLFAWSQWNREPHTAAAMPRWLSLSGIFLSTSFFIVIIAQAIPTLILGGCE